MKIILLLCCLCFNLYGSLHDAERARQVQEHLEKRKKEIEARIRVKVEARKQALRQKALEQNPELERE